MKRTIIKDRHLPWYYSFRGKDELDTVFCWRFRCRRSEVRNMRRWGKFIVNRATTALLFLTEYMCVMRYVRCVYKNEKICSRTWWRLWFNTNLCNYPYERAFNECKNRWLVLLTVLIPTTLSTIIKSIMNWM